MNKTVFIHQPDFFPWIGFFDKIRLSNIYIVLDDVQFLKRGWHNRDKIKGPEKPLWITVPVKKKGRFFQKIMEVEIDNSVNWKKKHLKMLSLYYKKSPNFEYIFNKIKDIYEKDFRFLIELNLSLIKMIVQLLDLEIKIILSSSIGIELKGNKKILELLKSVKADSYITGLPSKEYIDEKDFIASGIKIIWHKFNHPIYHQRFGKFIENMSIIDFLFNSKKTRWWE